MASPSTNGPLRSTSESLVAQADHGNDAEESKPYHQTILSETFSLSIHAARQKP